MIHSGVDDTRYILYILYKYVLLNVLHEAYAKLTVDIHMERTIDAFRRITLLAKLCHQPTNQSV